MSQESDSARRTAADSEVGEQVCLVITYYEAGEGLRDSLRSVRLRPTDSIIVVDDGSKRLPARGFIEEKVGGAPVRLVELAENRGVAAAARIGVEQAPLAASYIARLDCRDICEPERFELQRAYLDLHPECGIVGSSVVFCDLQGSPLYTHHQPNSDAEIRKLMRINCAFTQPSVMFRRSAYDSAGGYREDFPYGEDYALFRAILRVSEGHNIARPLVMCATMDGGISQRHRRRQLMTRMKVIVAFWDWHPGSVYGVVRACAQLLTSRNFTTRMKRLAARFRSGGG